MDTFEREFPIASGEPVFAGHFPRRPIMPGVLTLALVRETVRLATGQCYRLHSIARQKFVKPIEPETRLTVSCRVTGREADNLSLNCRFTLPDGGAAGSVRLCLEPCK